MESAVTRLPLDDVVVVDLSQGLAGPRCTKMLAELGAEVIKVEPPDGDVCRRYGPLAGKHTDLESSALFLYLNLNKRGVTLNLESAGGRKLLSSLVEDADILVESFVPGHLEDLGLGYESLREVNPGLVMTSVTDFGATGPYRDFQATDLILYALGGMMYVSGRYDRHPLTHAYQQAYHAGGLNAAVATMAALHYQRETGSGQHIDVSIFETVASEVQLPPARYAYTGGIETRGPKEPPAFVKGFIELKDGYIGLNASGRNPWQKFADFLGVPELTSDEFNTASARNLNARKLNHLLQDALKDHRKDEFWHEAVAESFTFQMVQTPEEAMRSPQLEARDYFVDVCHPVIGMVSVPGDPYGFSRTPWQQPLRAPLLGEDNAEIYGERLGLEDDVIRQLRESGDI